MPSSQPLDLTEEAGTEEEVVRLEVADRNYLESQWAINYAFGFFSSKPWLLWGVAALFLGCLAFQVFQRVPVRDACGVELQQPSNGWVWQP